MMVRVVPLFADASITILNTVSAFILKLNEHFDGKNRLKNHFHTILSAIFLTSSLVNGTTYSHGNIPPSPDSNNPYNQPEDETL